MIDGTAVSRIVCSTQLPVPHSFRPRPQPRSTSLTSTTSEQPSAPNRATATSERAILDERIRTGRATRALHRDWSRRKPGLSSARRETRSGAASSCRRPDLAIAKQRLDSACTLNIAYWSYRDDIQKGLINLASEEIDDAIRVLKNAGLDLHVTEQTNLASARTLLAQAVAATDPVVRRSKTESAIAIVQTAKAAFGTNMNFQLGSGNLMF
jgi:hypothetical protein